jgi:hypothetical protein
MTRYTALDAPSMRSNAEIDHKAPEVGGFFGRYTRRGLTNDKTVRRE